MIAALLPSETVSRPSAGERLLRQRIEALAREGRNLPSVYFVLCQERLIEESDASAELVAKFYRPIAAANL